MADSLKLWTREQLADELQSLCPDPPNPIDPADVPGEFHPLLPYAEWWGYIGEHATRDNMVKRASLEAVGNLCAAVETYEHDLSGWLARLDDERKTLTLPFLAFVALTMASDVGRMRLRRNQTGK